MSTITREFTKEQLIAAACSRIDFAKQMLRGNPLPLAKRKWEIELSLSEVALASLEAEASGRNPVLAYADSYRDMANQGVESIPVWSVITDLERNIAPLFTVPPAPVSVPDELTREEYKRRFMEEDDFDNTFRGGWNACRAAMLQGADGTLTNEGTIQDSNSPGIPDGWVACSELMPDIGTEIFYFCQDDGLRDCGIVSSSNFSGKGHAELYVHAEGYDLRFGVDITHWMPLPAAPQHK